MQQSIKLLVHKLINQGGQLAPFHVTQPLTAVTIIELWLNPMRPTEKAEIGGISH
jgi:hypothetical protein